MRLLSRALLYGVLVLAVALAVINRQDVTMDLGAWDVTRPLYQVVIAVLALGVFVGWLIGWIGAAPHRRRAREEGRRATMLDDRLKALETQRAPSPPQPDALPSPRTRIPAHMDDE